MPSAEVDIDDLRADFSDPKYAARAHSSTHSHSTSSAALSMGDEDDAPPASAPDALDYRRVQQASSFDVQEMINMRESTFRDSLMPGSGFGERGSTHDSGSNSGGRQTEMGNALMRMDESYRRAYNSNSNSNNTSNSHRASMGTTPDGLTPLLQAARAGDI
ncbi:hypothetical protein PR003_g22753, partial [Phytophthora rubi]